jgi:hypothetical protein
MSDAGTKAYIMKIKDLRNQLEAERRARVWHVQNSVDTARRASMREMVADMALEADKRRRRISQQRLRRAKRAEQEAVKERMVSINALMRAENAEAELRVEKAQNAKLREALDTALGNRENVEMSWRISSEEWERKYREAIENSAKKWEHAVSTWQARYEDALRRLDRCKAELKWHGGECDD